MLRKSSQKTEMKRDRQNRQSFIRKSLVENQCWLMLRFNEPQWKVDLIIEPLYELSIKSDSIRVQIREREKQRQSKKSSPHVRWKKIYKKKKNYKEKASNRITLFKSLACTKRLSSEWKNISTKIKKGLNERNKNVLSFFNKPGTCIYMDGSHALTHAKLTKRNTKWKVFPDSCFVSFDSQAIRLFIRSLFFHGSSKRKFFIVNLNPIEWNKNKTKTRMSRFMYLCRLGCLVNHENHDLHLIDWIENPTNLFQWFFVPLWLAGTSLLKISSLQCKKH